MTKRKDPDDLIPRVITDPSVRFWSRVDRRSSDECWLWTGAVGRTGYGKFNGSMHKFMSSHRFAWIDTNGPVADGGCVLHKCDVRACCNPAHLWIGSQSDNVADMLAKGRRVVRSSEEMRGERNTQCKLTREIVIGIRERVGLGDGKSAIAREFGVSPGAVTLIVQRKTWKHV